jgi:hypothetical protein
LWCIGRMVEQIEYAHFSPTIKKFESIFDLVNEL